MLDFHLKIKPRKLGHMPRCVGVFGPENGTYAEHTLPASCNLELFVELGRLGEKGLFAEICEAEDVSAALRCCSDEAGRFKFLELAGFEV
jgi:hypothetical protein